ncbi:hypothetical protein Golob_006936 [Gossypium lobatum]|uniref:Uncharacterized protein n=1 Tax=Gossypium lobatum TaxID=34289 RepID=A0A7J8NIE7_9ROSI|nr:hypothetical protein [Gossypium lobatum]
MINQNMSPAMKVLLQS